MIRHLLLSLSPVVILSRCYMKRRFRGGKNLFQNIRKRREYGKFERRFALSGASSVCEAPERAKRLSNFPYSRLCLYETVDQSNRREPILERRCYWVATSSRSIYDHRESLPGRGSERPSGWGWEQGNRVSTLQLLWLHLTKQITHWSKKPHWPGSETAASHGRQHSQGLVGSICGRPNVLQSLASQQAGAASLHSKHPQSHVPLMTRGPLSKHPSPGSHWGHGTRPLAPAHAHAQWKINKSSVMHASKRDGFLKKLTRNKNAFSSFKKQRVAGWGGAFDTPSVETSQVSVHAELLIFSPMAWQETAGQQMIMSWIHTIMHYQAAL